jgi:hypothetical protein
VKAVLGRAVAQTLILTGLMVMAVMFGAGDLPEMEPGWTFTQVSS